MSQSFKLVCRSKAKAIYAVPRGVPQRDGADNMPRVSDLRYSFRLVALGICVETLGQSLDGCLAVVARGCWVVFTMMGGYISAMTALSAKATIDLTDLRM